MSRPQDPRTSRRLRSGFLDTLYRRPVRDLQIERLESRVVLSMLPATEAPSADAAAAVATETGMTVEWAGAVAVIDTETIDLVAAQSAPEAGITGGTSAAIPAMDPSLSVVGLVSDTTAVSGTAPTAPPGGGNTPGGSGQPLLPPVIMDFSATSQGDTWHFSGRVLDDKNVTGLTVHFSGLLAGYTATVKEDGFFELLTFLSPGASGNVSAYTIDSDGLRSETASLWIG